MDDPVPPDVDPADLAGLLDLLDDALLVRDWRTTAIVSWSPAASRLYGWTASEALGQAADDLLRTVFPAPLPAIMEGLQRDGRWVGDLQRTAKDGRQVFVESRWALRRGRAGDAPLTILEVDRSIAARRVAQTARDLLDAAPDAVVAVDARGRIALVNAAAEGLYGYRREELVGQPEEVLLPGGLRERHAGERAAYLAAPRSRPMGAGLELSGRRRDGSTFPAEAYLVVLPSEDGPLFAAIIRDLSESRRREAAQAFLIRAGTLLAGSLDHEATLRQVLRLAVPALADFAALDLLDDAGRLVRLGMAHRDTAEDAALQALVQRDPLALARETATTRALDSGTAQLLAEVDDAALVSLAQDAAHLVLLRRLAPRSLLLVPLLARGRALGVAVLGFAGSGRRYGETDRALAEELAARAALAIDNARLYHQAQTAIAARDGFLAAVSHDLRNPLAVAKMAAQTLAYQARRGTAPEDLLDGLADIDRAVSRSDAMVGQLLDVARLQAGQPLALRRRVTDLVALARQAATDQQQLSRAHTVQVEAGVDRLVGLWDAPRLERVLTNLIGNAIKYSPQGSDVAVTLRREDEQAVLVVQDQGIGIPAADLAHVFQPFHRAANVGTIGGTGIGLASAKQVVEQHGGSIAIASTQGQGTTVTVRLPLAATDTAETTDLA